MTAWWRRLLARYGSLATALRATTEAAYPPLDLTVRLALAQPFLASGIIKLASWNSATYLATYVYPVSWLTPHAAATLGVVLELGGAALLAVGLFTRLGGLALLALSVMIRTHYPLAEVTLYWIALSSWFVVFGGGPLSLDRWFARGFEDIAIPFAFWIKRLCRLLTTWLTAPYLLTLRLALAVAMLAIPFPRLADLPGFALWIPPAPAALGMLAVGMQLALALAIAAGFALRLVVVIAILLCGGSGLVVAHPPHIEWAFELALLASRGAGTFSLDRAIGVLLGRAERSRIETAGAAVLPRVVIVGGGFGSIAAARGLRDTPCSVLLVDQHNYHLFQPLLYQVATAGLSPADIATPIRAMFREQENGRVILGQVSAVDTREQCVVLEHGRLHYDHLVIATGARHSYFGHEEWGRFAPGLKGIGDATGIRRRILSAFEAAENTEEPELRDELLTFVVVGGGPTGVELAGAIAELARYGMTREFRIILPDQARIVLIQAGPRILPAFPEPLSAAAHAALATLGVEVLVNQSVSAIDARGATVAGVRLPTRNVFWAAGVAASPAAAWLGVAADAAGRVNVGSDLSVPAHPSILVIGDVAASEAWNGRPVPGLAPAAKQGGQYAARVISARSLGSRPPVPF